MKTSLTAPDPTEPSDRREILEREADVARNKLVITLTELDRRRKEFTDTTTILSRARKPIAMAAVTIAAIALVAVGVAMRRRAKRGRRLGRERIEAVRRLWDHPEWVAPKRRTWLSESGRRLLLTAVEAAGTKAIDHFMTASPRTSPDYQDLAHRPTEPEV